jgi:hypothetical protein
MPPAIDLGDGGHARCWLNEPAVAGDRYDAFVRGAIGSTVG